MTLFLLRLELRRSRALLGWLSLLVVAYSGLLAAVFPSIRDNAASLESTFASYPQDVLAAFGLEGSLADPGVYYSSNLGILLWPLVASMAAIILATRATATDTERGWIELPMSGRLTRTGYLLASISVQAIGLAILAVAMIGAYLAVGALVGADFVTGPFVLAGFAAWLFGLAVAAVTTLVGVLTLSRGIAGGLVAGALLVMYVFRIISNVVDELGFLGDLSVFNYLYPTPIVRDGTLPLIEVAGFVVLIVASWSVAVLRFRERDLIA